jgi:hypothetical protein
MKIIEAKKRIARQRLTALAVMTVAALFAVCAGLKSIYFAFDGDTSAFAGLSQGVQRLVRFIYEHTQFVSWVWDLAPVVSQKELDSPGNFGFLFIICCVVVGRMMWDSATNLSSRIAGIIKRVEELGWERELLGQQGLIAGAKPDVLQISIELDQNDQWYKRPMGLVILGAAIAVLGQWANLKFGLVK